MKTIIKTRLRQFAWNSAQKLNAKTEKLSTTKKKLALFLFCISFSGSSLFFVLQAFISKTMPKNGLFIQRVGSPAHIGKTNDLTKPFFVSPADSNRVELIKRYLDSISVADKQKYVEIMKTRPRLLDSIKLFENFYLQHQKLK